MHGCKADADAHPSLLTNTQHCDFFDTDGDGILYPIDTYRGFRRIGYGRLYSFAAIFAIHGTFSIVTWPSWLPRLSMPIYLDRMHRTKHGSDSEVYDTEGRFVPEHFEAIFSKFATGRAQDGSPALSWDDIQEMLYANMNVMDPIGWVAGRLEWWTLWGVAADEQGLVTKERIRQMFDGSLWPILEEEANQRRGYVLYPDLQKEKQKGEVPAPGRRGAAGRADGGPPKKKE